MYLAFPLESLTSLEKRRYCSKRKTCRSLAFRMICFGSQTWKFSCRITSPNLSSGTSQPSRRLRCMASFAFLGTLSMCCKMAKYTRLVNYYNIRQMKNVRKGARILTSKPSLISPWPSSQQESKSLRRSWYFVILMINVNMNAQNYVQNSPMIAN